MDGQVCMNQKIAAAFILFFIAGFAGCTSLGDMHSHRFTNEGYIQNYETDYETAYKAAYQALGDHGITVRDESFDQKYIIGKQGGRTNGLFLNYGELVGVYFRERDDGSIDVRVVSERIYKPGVLYYEDWSQDVQVSIASHINYNS